MPEIQERSAQQLQWALADAYRGDTRSDQNLQSAIDYARQSSPASDSTVAPQEPPKADTGSTQFQQGTPAGLLDQLIFKTSNAVSLTSQQRNWREQGAMRKSK